MMNIFDIQSKIDAILEEANENQGEIGESRLDELAIAEEDLADKLYAYAFICDRYDTDVALLKQYKAALDDRIKRAENKKAKLRQVMADCVWKYGEPVLKKNKDTGLKEETGSYSLKYPNISLTVKKGVDVNTDSTTFDIFVGWIKDVIDDIVPEVDAELYEKANGFIDIKFNKAISIEKAKQLRKALVDCGIYEEDCFDTLVNKSALKAQLLEDSDKLDAWELKEKDVITVRK